MSVGVRVQDLPKARAFGAKAALCIEGTFDGDGCATVNIELAPREGDSVNWSRKLVFQATQSELVLIAAVMCGFLPSVQISRGTKGLFIERQTNKLFLRATAGSGTLYLLPATIGDTFFLSVLVLERLKLAAGCGDDTLMAALKGAATLIRVPSV